MDRKLNIKFAWLSGETCASTGIYFADTCGHLVRKEYEAGDVFVRCPTCHQAVRWMRMQSLRLYHSARTMRSH